MRQAVSLDSAGLNKLHWVQDFIPLIAGLAGVVLLIAEIVLVWLRRDEQPEEATAPEPEPALDPAL